MAAAVTISRILQASMDVVIISIDKRDHGWNAGSGSFCNLLFERGRKATEQGRLTNNALRISLFVSLLRGGAS